MRIAPALAVLLLAGGASADIVPASGPVELAASIAGADTAQVSRIWLEWRDTTTTERHRFSSVQHRESSAPVSRAWRAKFAEALLPKDVAASDEDCPVLQTWRAGPGPWLVSVTWASRTGRGQAIVDLADSCAYVVMVGHAPVSISLDANVPALFALARQALPADTALQHATLERFVSAARADTSLPAIDDFVVADTMPSQLVARAPEYPAAAREAKIQGTVMVKALVDWNGSVRDAVVTQGVPELNDAALASVRTWTFKPATYRKRAIAVWVVVPVKFRLF